jgi:hypothetical protein
VDSGLLKGHERKEERKKAALEKHQRLSRLFREDRLAFERERRKMIQEVIESAGDEALKRKLLDFQSTWDKRMKGAASEHNRFVLAQTFFWEHFHNAWQPAVIRLKDLLNQKKD